MKLQDQCCTIEQAKRLKELGVMQDAYAYHYQDKTPNNRNLCFYGYTQSDMPWNISAGVKRSVLSGSMIFEEYAAFTVAELGIMLPNHYPSWRFPVPGKDKDLWIATVICQPRPPAIDDIHTAHEFDRMGDTQAQALAILLIALLDTQTITVEEINKRLAQSKEGER